MRNSTRTEIRTLREIAHFFLPLVCCEFCGEPLLDLKLADKVFGDKAHTPLKKLKLTVHHRNGKHRDNQRSFRLTQVFENNESFNTEQWNSRLDDMYKLQFAICGNTSLVHSPCHRQYEMKANHHKRKVMKVEPLREQFRKIADKINFKNLNPHEARFVMKTNARLDDKTKTVTRYELRRLKKLAAKVGGLK